MAARIHVSVALLLGALCVGGLFPADAFQVQRRVPGESADSPLRLVTLGGWVRGEYGKALPSGVRVRLTTDEGMIDGEQPVNAGGYFEFPGLAAAYYHLTVAAAGFQTYQQDVDLRSVGNRLNINVQLSPIRSAEPRALSSLPARSDAKAPRNARKEYLEGTRAFRDGKWSRAEAHLKKAVGEYPCYARAQTLLAIVLVEQHNLARSEAGLKQAIECDPDYPDAYAALGRLYYDEKRYTDSTAALEAAVRRSPGSWQLYYQLGSSDYGLRDYPKAEQAYLRAESLNPAAPAEIHVKLADVYLKETAYGKAYAEMQAYLRAEPNGRFAAELKSVTRRMESDGTVHASPAVRPPPSNNAH
jgi:tetratricopeptide (TPR) repeat protein